MESLSNEMFTKKVETLKKRIEDETMLIDEYQSQIEDLEKEISDYENEYDYESDPNGIDYDLGYIHQLREEIEGVERLVGRSEWEIQNCEDELNQIEFWLGECSIHSLLNKWETKLNSFISKKSDCEINYRNGYYENTEDYNSDFYKWCGMIDVSTQLVEDIKHLMEVKNYK
jgi:chromosome segregation ATPase